MTCLKRTPTAARWHTRISKTRFLNALPRIVKSFAPPVLIRDALTNLQTTNNSILSTLKALVVRKREFKVCYFIISWHSNSTRPENSALSHVHSGSTGVRMFNFLLHQSSQCWTSFQQPWHQVVPRPPSPSSWTPPPSPSPRLQPWGR